jgi:hypothetical protein
VKRDPDAVIAVAVCGLSRVMARLLQGLKGGDGGADVSTELGYEPLELCNHGGIHDLGSTKGCKVVQLRSRRSPGKEIVQMSSRLGILR